MHSNLVINRYIYERLTAVAALMAPSLPGVGGRIYDGSTTLFPAVLYDANSNDQITPTIATGGASKKTYYAYYLIKVVGKDTTKEALEATYDLVRDALADTYGAVAGGGWVNSCKEVRPYSLNYKDPVTSIKYPEVGGFWSFIVELITVP